jgi:hypothetical protein
MDGRSEADTGWTAREAWRAEKARRDTEAMAGKMSWWMEQVYSCSNCELGGGYKTLIRQNPRLQKTLKTSL